MSDELVCWNCGKSIADIPLPISRHASCSACFEMLHNCRMCHFSNLGVVDDCDEDRADPPVIKESANFCEYFKPVSGRFKSETLGKQSAAVSSLNSLFGENEEDEEDENETPGASDLDVGGDTNDGARSRLNDLFDD